MSERARPSLVRELRWAWNTARLSVLGPLLFGGARCWGPSGAPCVALTFDDGPDPETTPAILDVLEAATARATFFALAPRLAEHPDLARRVAGRHEVGTHLYSHDREVVKSRPRFDEEMRRVLAVHEEVLGAAPRALRFPFGAPGRIRAEELRRWGLSAYHWTFSSEDSSAPDGARILRHVVPRLHAGAIVLFHDGRGPGSRKGTGSRRPTLEALPGVLRAIADLGLETVTVSGLFEPEDGRPGGMRDSGLAWHS